MRQPFDQLCAKLRTEQPSALGVLEGVALASGNCQSHRNSLGLGEYLQHFTLYCGCVTHHCRLEPKWQAYSNCKPVLRFAIMVDL